MFLLGCYTMLRVLVLIALAALVWVPIGVWIGMNPRWPAACRRWSQFLAAFPANLMFPVAVVLIVRWHLNPNIWLSPLMVLGTQWYLLFNVIAGASTIPTELRYAAAEPRPDRLAQVEALSAAGDLSELRHRRHHGQRRLVEREHRRRVRDLGRHDAAGRGPGQLHRAHDRHRRLSPHRARHRA